MNYDWLIEQSGKSRSELIAQGIPAEFIDQYDENETERRAAIEDIQRGD